MKKYLATVLALCLFEAVIITSITANELTLSSTVSDFVQVFNKN